MAEAIVADCGVRKARRYVMYVSGTQEQADKHVQTIARMLESESVAQYAPEIGKPKVSSNGNRQWNRQIVQTATGYTVESIGLNKAVRGQKIDWARPDLIVFDDVDERHDSVLSTRKKEEIITSSILPAGASNSAALFVQNLIHPESIAARLARKPGTDGAADYLMDRIISGPFPAVDGLSYELQQDEDLHRWIITGGTSQWLGFDLAVCEDELNRDGPTSYLSESQHEVDAPAGGMFDHLQYRRCKHNEVPWDSIVRSAVWVDPAVTTTDESDSMGIQADCIASDGTIYRLWSWEQITTPENALRRAILKAVEVGSLTVGVETDQGGDTWKSVYALVVQQIKAERILPINQRMPTFQSDKAGAGHGPKAQRASQMLVDYEQGGIVHVTGTHEALERALRRFPKSKPFDLVDAAYWSWYDLRKRGSERRSRSRAY